MGPRSLLEAITIRDLAVARQIDIEFQPGLTVLTGETGAGKSILIEALGLALGDRADTSMVSSGVSRASVSATFDIRANTALQARLAEHGLDNGGECILRRVLSNDGRSRAFCNETPVPIQLLRSIGELLVDIHGQHAHQSLLRKGAQRTLIDEFGKTTALAASTRAAYERWKSVSDELAALIERASDVTSRRELLSYQLTELETLNLSAGELERLEVDHRKLANANHLIDQCESISGAVFDSETGVLTSLTGARAQLTQLLRIAPELSAILALMDQAVVNLEEVEREIRRFRDSVEIDTARLQEVERRLEISYNLSRKHRCEIAELPMLFDRLAGELQALEHREARVHELENEIAASLEGYHCAATELHEKRRIATAIMSDEIGLRMRDLGMPHAVFKATIEMAKGSAPSPNGYDQIDFMVSTNPDQAPRELRKVASGGELSRISLAIQVATAGVSGVPILVYDELDTGVGGHVADILSRNLRDLATRRQVLCITHLPQVASAGEHHILIDKTLRDGVTHSEIRVLGPDERVEEVARMLSGRRVSEHARAHARELLERSAA